jgi:putative glutamine amidotransferase
MVPLIGVSGRRFPAGQTFKLEDALSIQSDYLDAVTAAGGRAVALLPEALSDDEADELLVRLDGLIMTGGPDVDPGRYGQEPAPETYGTSAAQDGFEAALFAAAQRNRTPVLAICRGLQLVNVLLGGTLTQHIVGRPGVGAHGVPNGGGGSDNTYLIEPGSRLSMVLGTSAEGRCHHHQAADIVPGDLVVSARTTDGIIEGLEYSSGQPPHWMLAVQWHPEETHRADDRLFVALVAAAR